MKNEINLLHSKTKSPLGALANKIDILRTIAVFLLFLVAILSVAFFFLVLVSPLSSLRKQENAKKLALRSLYSKVSDLYIINDRVKGVSDVIDKRLNLGQVLSEMIDTLPSGIEVEAISSTDNDATLDVSSTSFVSLQEYIQSLTVRNETNKLFKSINQSTLSLTPNSDKVRVTITFTY